MSKELKYIFPLCIQLSMPEDLHGEQFKRLLKLLQKHDFYGIELNVDDLEKYTPGEYTNLLDQYGLKLTMIATGAYAKKGGNCGKPS